MEVKMYKQLYRSKRNKLIGGVCGGLADYFEIDPVIIRIIFIVTTLGWGLSLIAYIILWIIVPEETIIQVSSAENIGFKNNINEAPFINSETKPITTSPTSTWRFRWRRF